MKQTELSHVTRKNLYSSVLLLFVGARPSGRSPPLNRLQIANMAVPAKSFQMVIYPVAQQKGYMKEEGVDERVIFVAPTDEHSSDAWR
jgi:hypothetical protein